jgi:hypothetical protein
MKLEYKLGQKITLNNKDAIIVGGYKDSSERERYYVFVDGRYQIFNPS